MASFLIRLVFAAVTLGAGVLLLRSQRLTTELLAQATAEVPGTLLRRIESVDNISRAQQGLSPRYRYELEFTLHGRPHRLMSYETTAVLEEGMALRVRYIPAHFEGGGVEDATWSAYAVELPPPNLPKLRPVVGWVFIAIGVLFAFSLVASIGVGLYLRAQPPE